MSSKPVAAVAPPLARRFIFIAKSFRQTVYRRVPPYARTCTRTHFTSRKRAGRNPGEVVRQSNIWIVLVCGEIQMKLFFFIES